MNDELTPEERDALQSLPRERMPSAALEERVVGAMRERGVLSPAPRARVIRLTTPRIATLVAASIALMIGAYSIGMHRGSFRPDVRETLEPRTADRQIMDETTPAAPPAEQNEPATSPPEAGLVIQSQPESGIAAPSRPAPESKQESAATAEKLEWKLKDTGTDTDAEARADARENSTESVGRTQAAEPAPAQAFARELNATMAKKSDAPPPQALGATDLRAWKTTRSEREYRLGSYLFMVDAPDSVRIVEDASGRTLLIYTSDGLIRLRVPE